MYPQGHMGVSLLLFAPFLLVFLLFEWVALAFFGGALMVALASVPDKDIKFQQRNTVFHKIPFLGPRIPKIKHRGITHTVWFGSAVGLFALLSGVGLFYYLSPWMVTPAWAFLPGMFFFGFFGVMGHVAGDVITPSGVNIWYPKGSGTVSWTVALAKNKRANYLATVMGVSFTLYVFGLIVVYYGLQYTFIAMMAFFFIPYLTVFLFVLLYIRYKTTIDGFYKKLSSPFSSSE